MNVNSMRIVDRLVGIPTCFALTMFNAIFGRRPGGAPPRNILIIQISEMGSLTLAWPAVRELKRLYPESRIHFLVFKRNRQFFDLLKMAEPQDVWTLDDTSMAGFIKSAWQFRRKALQRGIDTVLDFELFVRASAILSYISGATKRAGFTNYLAEGLYRGRLLTHPVFYNAYKHISMNFAAMVRALAADPREQPTLKQVLDVDLTLPSRTPPPERIGEMRKRIAKLYPGLTDGTRLAIVSPLSNNLLPIRAWPIQHYETLIRTLLDRTDDTVVLVTGLPDVGAHCQPLFDRIDSPRLIDFIGQTANIAELVDLFGAADLFVTSDSGPPHFASLTDIPTIVMFGPETPTLYGPLGDNTQTVYLGMSCSPCVSAFNHRNTPCENSRCMKEIDPERILDLALDKLTHGRNNR